MARVTSEIGVVCNLDEPSPEGFVIRYPKPVAPEQTGSMVQRALVDLPRETPFIGKHTVLFGDGLACTPVSLVLRKGFAPKAGQVRVGKGRVKILVLLGLHFFRVLVGFLGPNSGSNNETITIGLEDLVATGLNSFIKDILGEVLVTAC